MDRETDYSLFQAIQFSKNQLEAIFNHLEPICLINQDFKIVRMNRSLADFLSKDINECIGQSIKKIFSKWDYSLITTNADLVFSARRSIQVHDYSMTEKGKSRI